MTTPVIPSRRTRDHLHLEICHHFVWFRSNRKKPFYVLNNETSEKLYIESYSAWFDTVNQYHGTEICSGLSFSLRVDGVFSDELCQEIPVTLENAASAPALWACASK